MGRMRRISIVALALVGLLSSSGLALAQPEGEDASSHRSDDTLLNFGYDPINHVLLWGISMLDGLYDCTLAGGALAITYGPPSDQGLIPADDISDDSGTIVFPPRPEDEVSTDLQPASDPFMYNGADDQCGVSGGDVTGPQGQVNHGMFMKLFNSLYEGTGRGCIVRQLAQSDLGKGDQMIKVADVDPDFAPVVGGEAGQVEFTSAQTACEHGGQASGENAVGHGKNQGGSDSPGKSGSAPGHNK
jgi:hypothetical protein